tara:strand:+ start:803 stop:955 length:153 start_codon:yes stop_codon:yes gene_type:complete
MNHYLATYVDFIQSIGFIFVVLVVFIVFRKLLLDQKNDDFIEKVKIKVEE